jgi:hypothetical protein
VANASVSQSALTVVATIKGGPAERATLLALLDARAQDVLRGFGAVTTLHFGRFVVFDCARGKSALAFESNYDGFERDHLDELALHLADHLDAIFASCEGYATGKFREFAAQKSQSANAFYVGHGGLSVGQIRNDESVRTTIEAKLDELDAAGLLVSMPPRAIADALKAQLATSGLKIGAVDRGLPKQPWAELSLYSMLLPMVAAAAVAAVVAAVVYEPLDSWREMKDPPKLLSDHDPGVSALIDAEDLAAQNGLTHVVAMKPDAFRMVAVRFVLWVVEQVHRKVLFRGNLSGIASIHFARWVLLDDGTLVFFSNYDGSWESYLGDFVDKAHIFLTAIWTNTRWFPKTHALMFGGASAESTFKQWTRTFQVRNPIWYSAYDYLTVTNVLNNAKIRELAGGALGRDDEVRAWLALL